MPTTRMSYQEADATDAWRRIYAFFGEFLGGGRPAQEHHGIA